MSAPLITVDTRQIDKLARQLRGIPRGVTRVAVQAMNRTATSTRAEMVRLVRGAYNIKAAAIRGNIKITRATWSNPQATVSSKDGPGIPLKEFSPSPRSAPSTRRLQSGAYRPAGGISVIVSKAGGRQVAAGVFLARMRSGHVGAFIRASQRPGARRLSGLGKRFIRETYGPSATYILRSGKYDQALGEFVDRVFAKEFLHNARRTIDREMRP